MKDLALLLVLLLTSPLWLAAALLSAIWFGVWWLFSLLRLPEAVNGPVAVVMLLLVAPFAGLATWGWAATAWLWTRYVLGDRLVLTPEGVELWRRRTPRLVRWSDIAAIRRRHTPPVISLGLDLRDDTRIEIDQFVDTTGLEAAAARHGIGVADEG